MQTFVSIPNWDTTNVQGRINTTITVSTTLECSRCCHQNKICDGFFYDKSSGNCATFNIEDGLIIYENTLGDFFYRKKDCLDSRYEYIWQLDICITFYASELSWNASQQRCAEDSGNLLEITGILGWWIGGTDVYQEGIFQWMDGERVTYTNWAYNQPDNMTNTVIPGGDCMRYGIYSKAKWFDLDCSNKFAFICENKMFL
ncbi:unnamed protein product [Mytilus coruscus]|uniref:MRC n=1 Tax=Mytilus coruscus TaxID=42192 RepID=A0A6J8BQQ2_MYTCO|nr:unnamed protein product [Mytilus coruscus]